VKFRQNWIFDVFINATNPVRKGFSLAFLLFPLFCEAQRTKPIHVLMLGDSHMVGYFGEHLQRYLHQKGAFHILSVAIGGAGSYTFAAPVLKNTCCGYRIRRTWADDSIGYNSPIRVVSGALRANHMAIGNSWNKNIDSLLQYWQPDLIVVELGNNRIDNHAGLIQKIRAVRPHSPIYWIGPFLRPGLAQRVAGIQKALKQDNNALLIPAWDLAGHDTLASFHMPSAKARKASERLASRICDTLHVRQKDWFFSY
jgi:hypothetical protein